MEGKGCFLSGHESGACRVLSCRGPGTEVGGGVRPSWASLPAKSLAQVLMNVLSVVLIRAPDPRVPAGAGPPGPTSALVQRPPGSSRALVQRPSEISAHFTDRAAGPRRRPRDRRGPRGELNRAAAAAPRAATSPPLPAIGRLAPRALQTFSPRGCRRPLGGRPFRRRPPCASAFPSRLPTRRTCPRG